LFDGLAVCDAEDAHPCRGCLLACRRNAHEVAFVGATSRPTGHHFVPFGKLIFNRYMDVGESSAEQGDKVFEAR